MRVIFEKVEKVIVDCPKRGKRANIDQCRKCDDESEVNNQVHCLYNYPVGECISSIGIALEDHEVYAVDLKPEFGLGGCKNIYWPVTDGVIGEPVYASKSKGLYCKHD